MRYMTSALVLLVGLAILFAGCAEHDNTPIAPAAKFDPDADYDGGNLDRKVVFVQSYEAFDALTGDVESGDFSYLPVPGSSCCDDCGDEGLAELPGDITPPPYLRVRSWSCMRTEERYGRTALVLEPTGKVNPFIMRRAVLFEYSEVLQGQVYLHDGTVKEFSSHAPAGEIAYWGVVATVDLDSLRFEETAYLYSMHTDDRLAARDDSVEQIMRVIAAGFELFAELTGGRYPTLATSTEPGGDTLEDLMPGGVFPLNPFLLVPTYFAWGAGAAYTPGAAAATTASRWMYEIQARGHDHAYLDLVLTAPPPAEQMVRNIRLVSNALEEYAADNNGVYPVSPSVTNLDGNTVMEYAINGYHGYFTYNPYRSVGRGYSPTSWNADADTISGAIAILIARPDFYMIRARGDDPHGYIDTYMIPDGRRSWAEREQDPGQGGAGPFCEGNGR